MLEELLADMVAVLLPLDQEVLAPKLKVQDTQKPDPINVKEDQVGEEEVEPEKIVMVMKTLMMIGPKIALSMPVEIQVLMEVDFHHLELTDITTEQLELVEEVHRVEPKDKSETKDGERREVTEIDMG